MQTYVNMITCSCQNIFPHFDKFAFLFFLYSDSIWWYQKYTCLILLWTPFIRNLLVTAATLIESSWARNLDCRTLTRTSSTPWTRRRSPASPLWTPGWRRWWANKQSSEVLLRKLSDCCHICLHRDQLDGLRQDQRRSGLFLLTLSCSLCRRSNRLNNIHMLAGVSSSRKWSKFLKKPVIIQSWGCWSLKLGMSDISRFCNICENRYWFFLR